MKTLALSMAVVATAMMVSCGNKADKAKTDADSTVVMEEVVEGVVVTEEEAPSLLDNIKGAATSENVQKGIAYVKQLIQSGKLAAARTYLEQIKPYADKVGLSSAVASASTALEKAEGLAGDVKSQADTAVAAARQQVGEAVTDAKQKAADAAQNAAQNAGNAVSSLLK